ncbi:MAG: hypothetical protein Q9226_000740 [Calogaya cf. arnoldii]
MDAKVCQHPAMTLAGVQGWFSDQDDHLIFDALETEGKTNLFSALLAIKQLVQQSESLDMRPLIYTSPTGSVVFIAFLSQVLQSECLPTNIPDGYVTELSDGQVQVHAPPTATSGTKTASIAFPPGQTNLWTSQSASSTVPRLQFQPLKHPAWLLKAIQLRAKRRNRTPQSLCRGGNDETTVESVHFQPGPTPRGSTSATSITSAQSRSPSDTPGSQSSLSPSNGNPSASKSQILPSSSVATTIGSSNQIQIEPSSTTEIQSPSPSSSSIGSVPAGSSDSDASHRGTRSDSQRSSSAKCRLLGPTSSKDAEDLVAPTEEAGVDDTPKLTSPVSAIHSGSLDGSSPIETKPSVSTISTEQTSTDSVPTGAEGALDGSADPTATTTSGGPSTRPPLLPNLPLPSSSTATLQVTQTTPESVSPLTAALFDSPTVTWTTGVPDLKLEVVTNPAWKSDTLITTTIPGSTEPTVVPVFQSCGGCGPGGSLVVLGGFKPGISYHLPKIPGFPSIPRFHLPCVAFCPSPGGPAPGGKPPQPGPPKREDENGNDVEDDGKGKKAGKKSSENDDKKDDNKDDNVSDKNGDKNDDKNDNKNNDKKDDKNNKENTTQDDEQNDEQNDEQDNEDDEENDEDEQQSTTSQTAEVTSSTATSSIIPSSTGSSTSSGTGIPITTFTAYIDVRPTDIVARDGEMEQYLLAAYSSLGVADNQADSDPVPTATALRKNISNSMLMTLSYATRSSSMSTSILYTLTISNVPTTPPPEPPAPGPTEENKVDEEEPLEEDQFDEEKPPEEDKDDRKGGVGPPIEYDEDWLKKPAPGHKSDYEEGTADGKGRVEADKTRPPGRDSGGILHMNSGP